MKLDSFRVVAGDPESSVIIHVPHSSTAIPDWVRARIRLTDDELDDELAFMTDALTEQIALEAAAAAMQRPWLFINQCSRLVVDPERFPDADQEPMAAPEIGMGPVYRRTAHGELLRDDDPVHEQELMDQFFHPYAQALSDLVDRRRDSVGRVVIVDLHSFPREELPYERFHHADLPRPPLCIGVDSFHTPPDLRDKVGDAFAGFGEWGENTPFAGSYVPLNRYGKDQLVESVMIELRRDCYMNDTLALAKTSGMLANLVDSV